MLYICRGRTTVKQDHRTDAGSQARRRSRHAETEVSRLIQDDHERPRRKQALRKAAKRRPSSHLQKQKRCSQRVQTMQASSRRGPAGGVTSECDRSVGTGVPKIVRAGRSGAAVDPTTNCGMRGIISGNVGATVGRPAGRYTIMQRLHPQ